MSSSYGIKVAKSGQSVFSVASSDLGVTSQFDTFKVFHSGLLTLELPQDVLAGADVPTSQTREISYTHNLGYVPFFTPMSVSKVRYTNSAGLEDVSSTDNFYANEKCTIVPTGAYSPTSFIYEQITLYATTTDLTLRVYRYYGGCMMPPCDDVTFGDRDCTCNYTVFYNRMDEAFSLL